MTVLDIIQKKQHHEKISMVTCYDYWSAQILDQSNIDLLLVGDSLAMVMHGHSSTLPADVNIMALHTESVVKGAPHKFQVADLPFLSYRKDLNTNMNAIEKLMKTGAQAVKLEGAIGNEELIQHIVQSGVPVMGHLGLTPQSIHQLGGFKVQGRSKEAAEQILTQAKALEDCGCFSIVLECVPSPVAREISQSLDIPTIGIGAGPDTDGQVLVLQDMLGMNNSFQPKFLRRFLDGHKIILEACNQYHQAVAQGQFPSLNESYE